MEPALAIALFTVVFAVTARYIWNRDLLFGGVYVFLYVYTVFTQIGYAYYPALSVLIGAYFGPEVFLSVSVFVTLSFLALFVCFVLFHRRVARRPSYEIAASRRPPAGLFYIAVVGHVIGLLQYFVRNYDLLTYDNASNEDFQSQMGIGFLSFGVAFKMSVFIILILYFLLRVRTSDRNRARRGVLFVLLLLEAALFMVVTAKLGNRTDPFALTCAVVVLELAHERQRARITVRKRGVWKWVKVGMAVAGILYALTIVESTRGAGDGQTQFDLERLLLKDYYAPAHILIAAMALKYVNAWEVFVSNTANALVMLKHPYLQATVADLFNPGISSRSASYAFYIFSEGFIAAGWLGCVYNGVVVFAGVTLWRRLANSNSPYYNLFMSCLVATQMANIARSQSSYFIKDIYMLFAPAMFLFYLATGLRPRRRVALARRRLNPEPVHG